MYAPIKPEPEWVELLNPSDSSVIVSGWTLSDKVRAYTLPTFTLAAHQYIVLTKDSESVAMKYAPRMLHVLNSAMPSLNNTGDEIVLRDSITEVIDSIAYLSSWGGNTGRSLERIDETAPSDSANFAVSVDEAGATPSAPNSKRRRDRDLALVGISTVEANSTNAKMDCRVFNKGKLPIQSGVVKIFSSSVLPLSESNITSAIVPHGQQTLELSWTNPDLGPTSFLAIIDVPGDEDRSSDTLHFDTVIPIPRDAILINEIMATPTSSSSQWIELYNQASNTVNMDGVNLRVGGLDTTYTFSIDSLVMGRHEYAVIAASKKFFTQFPNLTEKKSVRIINKSDLKLGEAGSRVEISNADSSVIDSLHYLLQWHSGNVTDHTGISLERKHFTMPTSLAENWTSSFDARGSTPLEKNSASSDTALIHPKFVVTVSPNPFSPDGDGFEDETTISIVIPSVEESLVTIRLFDSRGRLRRIVSENQRVPRQISIPFNGKDENDITLPIGLYTLVVESPSFPTVRKGIVIVKRPR